MFSEKGLYKYKWMFLYYKCYIYIYIYIYIYKYIYKYYDRIDVYEVIDVKRTSVSKECDICHY